MQVDIYIRERDGSREIRIPWLPDEISYDSGGTQMATYEIMNKGEVAVPTGSGLATYSWSGEFPGKNRTDTSMLRGTWQEPQTYHNIMESWKENRTPLTILVTGYPINKDVILKDYSWRAGGAFGDIAYEVSFVEDRDVVISSTKVEASTTRPAATTTSYTVKKGDTLWAIAKRFLGAGSKWGTIYSDNKTIIEKTAVKYGRKSSDNGHWIYPGTKLTIPGASSTGGSTSSPASSNAKKYTITVKNAGVSAYWGTYQLSINGTVRRLGKASDYSIEAYSGAKVKITAQGTGGHTYKISNPEFTVSGNATVTITWAR